jgi:hypothetical protein
MVHAAVQLIILLYVIASYKVQETLWLGRREEVLIFVKCSNFLIPK